MRKTISLLVCFSLLSCLSLHLNAQSAEEELNQLELLKKFIGTWEAEIGEDSTVVLIITTTNHGLKILQEDKVDGETYLSYNGIFGVSNDQKSIIASAVAPNGTMILDIGKFVDKDTYVVERYFGNTTHSSNMLEWKFITDDSFAIRAIWRGNGITWPDDWEEWFTFRKIY